MNATTRLLTTASLTIIGAALSSQALAQDAAAAPDADVASDGQEIIVTAQKRSERLMEVPVSVTAVSADDLTQTNRASLKDYYASVPGLSLSGDSGQTTLAIRGVTTGSGNTPTVALTIDDVPFGSSSYAGFGDRSVPDLDPASLTQIEVLRGPQGTLYGANSLGGLIKYVTRAPDTDDWSGRIELGANAIDGGAEGVSARGFLNAPISSDAVGLNVSAFYRRDPGFIDNTLAGVKDSNKVKAYGGRAALLFKAGEDWTITLSVLAQNLDGFDAATRYLSSTGTVISQPGGTAAAPDLTADLSAVPSPYSTSIRLYQSRITGDLGFADLTSITAYGQNKYDTVTDATSDFAFLWEEEPYAADRAIFGNAAKTDKFSQELRLSSQGEQTVDWLIGGFYTYEKSFIAQTLFAVNSSGVVDANWYTGTVPGNYREIAGFGDLTYHFNEQFDIQVGARYAHNVQHHAEFNGGILSEGAPVEPERRTSDSSFTWLVSPRYRFSPDAMLYARIASGYRPGGPNTLVGSVPPSFGADRTVNYELGFKGMAMDRKITVDGSLFWIEWQNIQLTGRDPATQFVYYQNGSHARIKGAELTLNLRPWEGMKVDANAAITDAKLTENLPSGLTAALYGLKGDRLPYSSKFSANLSLEQEFPLGNDATGFVGGSMSYLGARPGNFVNFQQPAGSTQATRYILPAYTTFDLRAGAKFGDYSINLYVRNLTDRRGYSSGDRISVSPTSSYSVTVIQPRTFGGSVAFSF